MRETAKQAQRLIDTISSAWGDWHGNSRARVCAGAGGGAADPARRAEAVLGDLRESYARRGDYVREILKAAPYVIASQMMRHLNLPVLMLQGAMIFWFFNGRMVALALPLLVLREAYQPLTRPDPRVAMRGALVLSFASLLVGLVAPMLHGHVLLTLLPAGPLSLVLCGLRTGVILGIDRYDTILPDTMPLAALRARHGDFLRRQRRRRWLDIAMLGVAALGWPLLIERSLSVPLSAVFLAAALYQFNALFRDVREAPTNFARLAQHYADEMQDDAQFRRFICWLWVVPRSVPDPDGHGLGSPRRHRSSFRRC